MSKGTRDGTVKSSRAMTFAGILGGWLMRLWSLTLRTEMIDHSGVTRSAEMQKPVIFVLWHQNLFSIPAAFRRFCPHREVSALISPSKDGSALAAAYRVLRISAVRGSSHRGGAGALIALRKALRRGENIGITPDGPKGPPKVLKPGVIKIAQASGCPIVPIHISYSGFWELNSWDKFRIPYPFSRIKITFCSAIEIPRKLSDEELISHSDALQSKLREHSDDLPDL